MVMDTTDWRIEFSGGQRVRVGEIMPEHAKMTYMCQDSQGNFIKILAGCVSVPDFCSQKAIQTCKESFRYHKTIQNIIIRFAGFGIQLVESVGC